VADNGATRDAVAHLFLVSTIGQATVVFLLETEPGVVEFPRLELASSDLEDEGRLVQRVREQTGMDVAISGFLEHRPDGEDGAVGTLVLARHLSGAPRMSLPHVGWEWTPGSQLMSLPFAPKMMLDELKAFMDD
jgi:hypothetical protein